MPVYFIQAGETDKVKIGHCVEEINWKSRLRYLQTAHYEALRVIRLLEGGFPEEKWLHRQFKEFHIRGEWFRLQPEMLTVIPSSEMQDETKQPRKVLGPHNWGR